MQFVDKIRRRRGLDCVHGCAEEEYAITERERDTSTDLRRRRRRHQGQDGAVCLRRGRRRQGREGAVCSRRRRRRRRRGRRALVGDEEVARGDVAMDDAARRHVHHRGGHLRSDVDPLDDTQTSRGSVDVYSKYNNERNFTTSNFIY